MLGCLSGGRGEWWEGGEGHKRRRRRRKRQEGRRWKLKPCSLIKTGVNFFSPLLQPKEPFTMATGRHGVGGCVCVCVCVCTTPLKTQDNGLKILLCCFSRSSRLQRPGFTYLQNKIHHHCQNISQKVFVNISYLRQCTVMCLHSLKKLLYSLWGWSNDKAETKILQITTCECTTNQNCHYITNYRQHTSMIKKNCLVCK